MAADVEIEALLRELGFADSAPASAARAALVEAGLTNPRKSRISADKLPRVRDLLDQRFARSCTDGACQRALQRQKPGCTLLTVADTRNCEHCSGSDNLKAMRRLTDVCRRAGVHRVVVVGGSPKVRSELQALKPQDWELRLVDGTERRTQDKARADLEWAHLVFIWGSSELDHRVSKLYTDAAPALRRKLVPVARRGIAALLTAGLEHLARFSAAASER